MQVNTDTVNLRLLFFAKTRELAGTNRGSLKLEVPPQGVLVAELLEQICTTYNLNIIKQNIVLAVNEDYCDNLQTHLHLRDGDEIAVIPPISGG